MKYLPGLVLLLLSGFIVVYGTKLIDSGKAALGLSWKYSNLLSLDPIDANSDSDEDIVAFYAQRNHQELVLRVDFLELPSMGNDVLWIGLDTHHGVIKKKGPDAFSMEIPWDYLVSIPLNNRHDNQPQVLDRNFSRLKDVTLWVTRDSRDASIQIGVTFLSPSIVWSSVKTQVVLGSDQGRIIDRIPPINLDTPPPPKVTLIPVFWNIFPSDTPAQALRSWNGAHTGRLSSRHGLSFLLSAIERYQLPVVIVGDDFGRLNGKLDYVGGSGVFGDLKDRGLLVPVLVGGIDYANIIGNTQIPTPDLSNSYDLRKFIFAHAQAGMIFLGGDFQQSIFGNQDSSNLLKIIKDQVWLEPASKPDVCRIFSCQTTHPLPYSGSSNANGFRLPVSWLVAMRNKPDNPFWLTARQMVAVFSDPAVLISSEMTKSYLGLIGHFQAGAQWAEKPYTSISCDHDLDHDGETECILSSEYIFATIKRRGGYLETLFVRFANGIHQVIGPTYQLSPELSDPSEWKLPASIYSDPKQILGGLFEKSDNSFYDYKYDGSRLDLYNPVSSTTKTFSLNSNGVIYEYKGPRNISIQIPLVLDPWIIESPAWGYSYFNKLTPTSYTWGIYKRLSAEVSTEHNITSSAFIDSRDLMKVPEDPNFTYPPGHYLPFPLAVTTLQCEKSCRVAIVVYQP